MPITGPVGLEQLLRLLPYLQSQQQQPPPDPLEQLRASLGGADNPDTGGGLSRESIILEGLGGLGDLGVSRASAPAPATPGRPSAFAKRSGILSKIAKGLGSVGKGAEDYREDRTGDEQQSKGVLGGIGRSLIPALQIVAGIALRDADTAAREQYNRSVFAGEQLRTRRGQTRRARELQKTLAQQRIDAQNASRQLRALQIQLQLSRLSFDRRQTIRKSLIEDFANHGFSGGKFEELYDTPEVQAMAEAVGLSKQALLGAFKAGPAKLSKRATAEQKVVEINRVRESLGQPKLTDEQVLKVTGALPPQGSRSKLQQLADIEADRVKRGLDPLTDDEIKQYLGARVPASSVPSFEAQAKRLAPGQARLKFLQKSDPAFYTLLAQDKAALANFARTGNVPRINEIGSGETLNALNTVLTVMGAGAFEDLTPEERLAKAQAVIEAGQLGQVPQVRTTKQGSSFIPQALGGSGFRPFGGTSTDVLSPSDNPASAADMTQEGAMLVLRSLASGAEVPDEVVPFLEATAQGQNSISDGTSTFTKVNGKWVKQ